MTEPDPHTPTNLEDAMNLVVDLAVQLVKVLIRLYLRR